MNTTSAKWKKGFYTITTGQTISLIGSSAVQFALIWWLASETDSPMMMALSGLMAFLPQLVLGPFVGVWIDRLSRKRVAIAADMFMGIAAAAFAVYFVLAKPPYWVACLVLGIRGVGSVFHGPAITAIVPMLVPQDKLVHAGGMSQFMQSGAFMLGPVLGALMYAHMPMPVILMTDLLGAVVACVSMAVVHIPEPPASGAEKPQLLREMKQGAQVILRDKSLSALLLTSTLCMIFYLPLASFYPLMTSSYFNLSAMHGSWVEISYAVGMMGAALLMSLMGDIKHKLRFSGLALILTGLTSFACGILPPSLPAFWVFVAVCALMGASGNLYGIPMTAYMQQTIPPEAQGRAFSLMGSLMSAAMPLGLALSGPVAESRGVPFWFFVSGIATVVFAGTNAVLLTLIERRKRK